MAVEAASAATCEMCGALMNRFCARHSTGRTRSSGSTSQPIRQPVMREILREAVDHHGMRAEARRRCDRAVVVQPVIDLVADQPHAGRRRTTLRSPPIRRDAAWCRPDCRGSPRSARPAAGRASPASRHSAGSASPDRPPGSPAACRARSGCSRRADRTARPAPPGRPDRSGEEGQREARRMRPTVTATRSSGTPVRTSRDSAPRCARAASAAERLGVAERHRPTAGRPAPPRPRRPARRCRAGRPPCGYVRRARRQRRLPCIGRGNHVHHDERRRRGAAPDLQRHHCADRQPRAARVGRPAAAAGAVAGR